MKSTRERILQTLLLNPNSTISDLAEAVDINAISVRHHLTNLQAEGLIQAQEERHGVGRPRLVYALTDTGAELFPTRYLRLVNQLFTQLKNKLPKKEVEKLLAQIAVEISADEAAKLRTVSMPEKMASIQEFLAREGFLIEWEQNGNSIRINEISCPFYHISHNHPEICVIDKTIYATLFSTPVEKTQCILNGDHYCSYLIKLENTMEKVA